MTDLPGLSQLIADPLLAAVLAGGGGGLLLLDYDGTLAPFRTDRDQAVPYPGVVDILCRLPRRFAVVSGRMAGEVEEFLRPAIPLEILGCHGVERLSPGSGPQTPVLEPRWEKALGQAMAMALIRAPARAVERKSVSVALHWRGMEPWERQMLGQWIGPRWAELAKEAGLVLHSFDGGLELRPPGWDKGRAVRRLRRENPGAVLVYLGDDHTDEDAFEALGAGGLGVLVRADWRPTAARYRITPPEELRRFLRLWAEGAQGVREGSWR